MADSEGGLAARVAALEKAVESLQRDIGTVLRHLAPGAVAPVRAPSVSTPPSPIVVEATPAPARSHTDLETLVGRYGMLALAAVLTLAAAGTFVGWAVKHGLLGPGPRVVLGLIAAAALGAWGIRLRARERAFGDSLLGISLAVVHVCGWAAGPGLHLVPPFLALAFCAVVSVALSGFALVQEDEALWCVGFGGAALAPFVTSTGDGTAPMLFAYAAAILIAAGAALGSRAWSVAAVVFGAAAALFVVATVTMPAVQHSAELALALPFVVAVAGVVPFAKGASIRPRLRTLGILAAGVALFFAADAPNAFTAIKAGAAALCWLVLVEVVDSDPAGTLLDGFADVGPAAAAWFDGALIPGSFLAAVWIAVESGSATAATFTFAAALLTFCCSRREGTLRDAFALVAFAAAIVAALSLARPSAPLQAASVAALAVLFTVLERAIPNATWRWAPMVALGGAGVAAIALVTARPSYDYVPFFTAQSAVALTVAIGWAAVARVSRSGVAAAIGWIFAFGWVNQELAYAVSPSVSMLLLVTWYAATGVACVGFGRARSAARLRQIGLMLAVLAALLALKAAWGLPSTAARIGSYLVVAAFLLGIAWWYRRAGPGAAAA